jgi:hypothetical protein
MSLSSLNQIRRPWLGDTVDFGIGLSLWPASLCSLVGRYTSALCRSQLYPPVRDYEFGNCSRRMFPAYSNHEGDVCATAVHRTTHKTNICMVSFNWIHGFYYEFQATLSAAVCYCIAADLTLHFIVGWFFICEFCLYDHARIKEKSLSILLFHSNIHNKINNQSIKNRTILLNTEVLMEKGTYLR